MATATAVKTTHITSISLKGSPPETLLRLHRVAFLQGVEPGVEAAGGDQLLVRAALGDAAVFYDQDLIHAPDQPELVGYDEGRPPIGQGAPALLDGGGGLGVETRLGLVQDQDRGVPQHRPRDGDALPLPPAQALPTFAEERVVALRQVPDETVGPRELSDRFDLLPARPGPPVGDVLRHRRSEQHRVLRHEGYGVPQGLEREVPDVLPVDEHPSFLRVVEAGYEAR